MCLTTVDMHHMQIRITVGRINNLHELRDSYSQRRPRGATTTVVVVVDNVAFLGVHNHGQSLAPPVGQSLDLVVGNIRLMMRS